MNKYFNESKILLRKLANSKIYATAKIQGNEENKDIFGEVNFYDFGTCCVVTCVIHNLPETETNIHGFHIHENGECEEDFSSAGPHFGEGNHPNHKGDMPVLFSNNGDAFLIFCTNRFDVDEIIDKAVIIHQDPDDFTSQPAGNSGKRIACGVIKKV